MQTRGRLSKWNCPSDFNRLKHTKIIVSDSVYRYYTTFRKKVKRKMVKEWRKANILPKTIVISDKLYYNKSD